MLCLFPCLTSAGATHFRVRQIVLSDAASGIKRTIAFAFPTTTSRVGDPVKASGGCYLIEISVIIREICTYFVYDVRIIVYYSFAYQGISTFLYYLIMEVMLF